PLPDCGEYRDGRRTDAGHGYSAATDELRRIVNSVHVSCARHCHEHPHAPFCELKPVNRALFEEEPGIEPGRLRGQQSARSVFGAYWIYPAVTPRPAQPTAPRWRTGAGLAALEFCRFFKD